MLKEINVKLTLGTFGCVLTFVLDFPYKTWEKVIFLVVTKIVAAPILAKRHLYRSDKRVWSDMIGRTPFSFSKLFGMKISK